MALIAFDADGPLLDFTGGLCSRLRDEGYTYWPHDVQHWDLSQSFHHTAMKSVDRIMAEAGFCESLPWMPGAKQLLSTLRAEGHDLICVTSPHHSRFWMHERRQALRECFPDDDILFIKGPRKALVLADILVEDHPGNAAAWCESNKAHGVALLVDRPWNSVRASEWACHPNMLRVSDDTILQWIRSL